MLNIKGMSIKEIQKKIDEVSSSSEIGESVFHRDFDHMEFDWCSESKKTIFPDDISLSKNENGYTGGWGDNILSLDSLGIKFEFVDGYGGEGEGDEYWGVAKLSDSFDNEINFMVSGWYASYHGAECDEPKNWQLVEPVEVKKVEYKRVKG